MLYSKTNKKAAIELSITTVIIIVIGVSLLILGMFLVRNIMCGAISLTGTSIDGAKSEIERLFGSTGSEVTCIGASGEPVKMAPGKTNIVYCAFRSSATNTYSVSIGTMKNTLREGTGAAPSPTSWVVGTAGLTSVTVPPSDNDPKKVLTLNIPKDTADSILEIPVTVKKGTQVVRDFKLTFDISRLGFIQNAIC